jgi:uncharacterized protein (DUF2141 family)
METSGTSNTYFVGTDVTPYGYSRDGVATIPTPHLGLSPDACFDIFASGRVKIA